MLVGAFKPSESSEQMKHTNMHFHVNTLTFLGRCRSTCALFVLNMSSSTCHVMFQSGCMGGFENRVYGIPPNGQFHRENGTIHHQISL